MKSTTSYLLTDTPRPSLKDLKLDAIWDGEEDEGGAGRTFYRTVISQEVLHEEPRDKVLFGRPLLDEWDWMEREDAG